MKKRKFLTGALSVVLVFSILFSQFVFGSMTLNASADGESAQAEEVVTWSGNAATDFAGGTGTSADPFIIENADQLYKVVEEYDSFAASYADNGQIHFVLANDIYINDVSDGTFVGNLSEKKNWLEKFGDTIANPSSDRANTFNGCLDGKGYTIYGLYVSGVARAGLFAGISNKAIIKNLKIENAHIKGGDGYAGAIAGIARWLSAAGTSTPAQITNVGVTNLTINGGIAYAGGLVGYTSDATLTISDCYTNNITLQNWDSSGLPGGLVGADDASGALKIKNSYSAGYFPMNSNENDAACTNVYTNVAIPEGNTTVGITVLTDAQMKGEAAKTNLNGFDFTFTWETVENGYPTVRDEVLPIWDGTKDTNLEGSGSVADPYLIKTASHLAAIVTGNNSGAFTGKYFKLVNDIRINDTTIPDWKSSARDWVWADFRFIGTFDGNGHTIDGLFYEGGQRVMGLFSYVGADNNGTYQTTLKNFAMTNAYISSTAADGAGFAAGQASRVAYFDGIYIDDTCEITSTTVKGVGGILGQSGYNVFMSNCAMNGKLSGGSNVGAFIGTLSSGAKLDIKSSYTTADLYVQGVTDRNLSTNSNAVYVVKKQGTIDAAATLLTTDQMKGENAKKYMTALSFKFIWETVENDFPIYNPRGELWDGSWVEDFSSFKGEGTEENPYMIENGAQLAYAVAKSDTAMSEAKHYKLANDIVLNDTSFDGWEASARGWVQNTSKRFNGEIDGDGHTIEGLYWNAKSGGRYGLVAYSGKLASGNTHVAAFKNITFTGASINNSAANEGASEGAAIVVGQASGETIFENIYIDETCKINAPNIKGVAGLVGRGYNEGTKAHLTITNCAVLADITGGSHVGAFTGTFWDTAVVITANNSFAVTNTGLIASTVGSVVLNKVYTTTVGAEDTGAEEVEVANMNGEAAKTYMPGLDFDFMWKIVEDAYPVLRDMDERLAAWTGDVATSLKGEGTKENPYKISNGAELYYAISTYSSQDYSTLIESKPYFELVDDINLNNIQWYNVGKTAYPQASNYSTGFAGVIYGNGYTIYNLSSPTATGVAGLIPVATQGTEIYDLHLNGGNLPKAAWNSYANGGLIGLAVGTERSTPITISGCSVENYTIASRDASGAFVGSVYSQSLVIKDCYAVNNDVTHTSTNANMNSAAFAAVHGKGNGTGNSITIENSYTDMNAKVCFENEITVNYNNVFTTDDNYDNTVNGITGVTKAQITGNTAKTNLKGFNFNQVWKAVDGEYPVHTDCEYRANFFSGTAAEDFESGTGTEADPYIIKTADQLYLLATLDRETTFGNYYKLGNDITISNIYTNWNNDNPFTWAVKKAYLDGFTYTSSFAGTLDGAGYKVSGLYYNNKIVDGGNYAYGLIPFVTADAIIKNITVSDTYAVVSGNGAYVGAVAGAAHVMKEDIETNILHAVQFVGVNVADATIGAINKGEILGGASYGVKFELCNTPSNNIHGTIKDYFVENNCNNSSSYRKNVIVVNSVSANEQTLGTIRKNLLTPDNNTYIATINMLSEFDIRDLVAAKMGMDSVEPEEYLVWSDEFNSDTLNTSVWTQSDTAMPTGVTLEYANNTTFDGENVKLNCYDTGKTNEAGNKIYSINYGLNTTKTMSYKYGRLEMRAKIPVGAGAFPALWLSSRDAIGYDPNCDYSTEVDVFEVFGETKNSNTAVACIHKWYNLDGVKTGDECSCGSGILAGNGYKVEGSDRSTEISYKWCTVVFEWTEDTMTFSIDDVPYYTARRSEMENFDVKDYDTNSDGIFNQFMYPIITNHMYTIGNTSHVYEGNESEITNNLNNLIFEIDYIRLYQKNDGKSQINLK